MVFSRFHFAIQKNGELMIKLWELKFVFSSFFLKLAFTQVSLNIYNSLPHAKLKKEN